MLLYSIDLRSEIFLKLNHSPLSVYVLKNMAALIDFKATKTETGKHLEFRMACVGFSSRENTCCEDCENERKQNSFEMFVCQFIDIESITIISLDFIYLVSCKDA